MDEIKQLRSLLLSEEQERLSHIEKELNYLSKEFLTPQRIIQKLAPLFASILKRSHEEDEALILQLFSPIVNKLIDESYKSSQDKVAKQIAPLISIAIREQIKSEKNDIVDALYPVIGSMISKFVTKSFEEILANINLKIQNGLSFKTLKRKIKAKVQGVSEVELLLQESGKSKIRALLLIHKETGLILAEAQDPNSPISEPEMVASMMSAIRSFVNDWIEKNEKHSEIGEIDYGGNKIILEDSGHSFLVVIVNGAVYSKTYEQIRIAQEKIVFEYGDEIKKFNGDLSKFPNIHIYKIIAQLLSKDEDENTVSNTKIHPLLYIAPLLLVLGFVWFYISSQHNKKLLESITTSFYQTPQLSLYKLDAKLEGSTLKLQGQVPSLYHKNLAQTLANKYNTDKNILNEIVVVSQNDDPLQLNSNIAYLIEGLNTDKGINLTYKFHYPVVSISGEVWDKKREQLALLKIKTIEDILEIQNKISITPPSLEQIIYFEPASAKISDDQKHLLMDSILILRDLDSDNTLYIEGYSDAIGTAKANDLIKLQRATAVKEFLENIGLIKQKIVLVSVDSKEERRAVIRLNKR